MKRVVFLAGTLSQPRIIKRISAFHNAGYQVKVYGYDRGVYSCNTFPSGIAVEILGQQTDGQDYLRKIAQNRRDIKRVVKKEGKDVLYYSFDIVSACFLYLLGVKYIREISDILYGYNRFKYVQPFAKMVDKFLVKKSYCTVLTSQGFVEYLFGRTEPKNIVVQPNKLHSKCIGLNRNVKKADDSSLTFGFVGAIRYPNTILRFAQIIGRYFPQHRFYFYGDSYCVDEFKQRLSEYENVKFFGAYKNPEDLPSIYDNIDVVVACYEIESLNERIAEPNKMYEAAFFCKPIVVSKDSFVAQQVQRLECGYAINAYDDNEIKGFVESLSTADMTSIMNHEYSLDKDILVDKPQVIFDKLQELNS